MKRVSDEYLPCVLKRTKAIKEERKICDGSPTKQVCRRSVAKSHDDLLQISDRQSARDIICRDMSLHKKGKNRNSSSSTSLYQPNFFISAKQRTFPPPHKPHHHRRASPSTVIVDVDRDSPARPFLRNTRRRHAVAPPCARLSSGALLLQILLRAAVRLS
ncbi:hypothetical protein Scep_000884 [Stephania cephalantha]|uniref:Uncharacterized protein n=1 Tax=Stephania cephalantha TaxID=152367 RepID=A0AAP0L8C8_9MAGN